MLQKYWLSYSAEAHSEATDPFHPLSYLHVLLVSKPCVVFPEVIVRIYFLLFIYLYYLFIIIIIYYSFSQSCLVLTVALWISDFPCGMRTAKS